MDEMEGDGAIALEALKAMKKVLAAAMAKMPAAAAEDETSEPEEMIEETTEAVEEPIPEELDAAEQDEPAGPKMTVLESITPKYGGGKSMPPEMSPMGGKLKAKKKGY